MIRAGIDNGMDGAIVAIDHVGRVVMQELMPTLAVGKSRRELDKVRLYEVLVCLRALHLDLYVVLEYAQVMPAQGAVSGFTIGRGYGAVEMALIALQIPHEIRRPKQWQKAIGVVSRQGLTKEQRRADIKAQVVQITRRRLPTLDLTPGRKRKPHDGLADAAGMALTAREIRPYVRGKQAPPPPSRT